MSYFDLPSRYGAYIRSYFNFLSLSTCQRFSGDVSSQQLKEAAGSLASFTCSRDSSDLQTHQYCLSSHVRSHSSRNFLACSDTGMRPLSYWTASTNLRTESASSMVHMLINVIFLIAAGGVANGSPRGQESPGSEVSGFLNLLHFEPYVNILSSCQLLLQQWYNICQNYCNVIFLILAVSWTGNDSKSWRTVLLFRFEQTECSTRGAFG